jgi:glycosyltransferase involved in cell wall biosynthesis
MLDYHMAKSALRGCYGAVTHSRFAKRAVEEFAAYPVTHIHFPRPNLDSVGMPEQRPDGKIRFLSFGMLNRNKMIDKIITIIGEHPTLRERVVYNVIGQATSDYTRALEKLIDRFGLAGTVNLLGYQPHAVLRDYIRETDVIVNLRNPHFGESSWVLLEAAFSAKPTLVWKHGYYDEFPDDTVAKVTDDNLVAAVEALATDEAFRQSLSQHILQYAQETFVTERYCQQLLDFAQTARRSRPLLELADTFASKIVENDPTNLALARLVAQELAVFTQTP